MMGIPKYSCNALHIELHLLVYLRLPKGESSRMNAYYLICNYLQGALNFIGHAIC